MALATLDEKVTYPFPEIIYPNSSNKKKKRLSKKFKVVSVKCPFGIRRL